MQGTIQNYTLEMTGEKKKEPLRVKQFDTNSRWARITLKAFGEPWPVPVGCRAYINIRKSDDTVVMNDCEIDGENIVTAPITEQATAIPGIQQAELYFLTIDGDIKSQTFPIQVLPAIMDQRMIESSNEFGTLQTAIIGAQEATRTAQDAAAEAMVQAGEARDAAEIAIDAAASIDTAVEAAAAAKTSETNAKASETAAARTKADVEALKEGFAGYDKIESGRKYANALTATAEGEGRLTVTDAWDAPVADMEIDGASEQVVTTGAQLLDIKLPTVTTKSGVTISLAADGGIRLNGTATDSGNHRLIDPNQNLSINCDSATLSLQASGAYDGVVMVSDAADGEWKNLLSVKNNATATGTAKTSKLGCYVTYVAGTTYNVTLYPMLCASPTAQPWEPYTGGQPSPSPAYPQEVKGVEHVVNSGAQLLDLSGVSNTEIRGIKFALDPLEGSITINGTATELAVITIALPVTIPIGTMIYLGANNTASNASVYLRLAQDNIADNITNVQLETINAENTFITTKDCNQLQIRVGAGATVTNITIKPMLNAGTAQPWEPYNNQQRETDLQVDIAGKNLFNKNALYSYNVGAVDIVQLDKGIRISNATARTYACAAVKLRLKPHTTYTFSGDITALAYKSMIGIRKSIDGGSSFIPDMVVAFSSEVPTRGVSRTFTTDENEYYALCLLCTNDVATTGTTTFENIQLKEGSAATTWEPYHNPQTVTIPLDEPLRGIGDARDRICLKDGVWGIERQFTTTVFDGSDDEGWGSEIAWSNALFTANLPNSKKYAGYTMVADILCDKLKADMPQKLAATIGESGIALGSSSTKVSSDVFIAVADYVDTKDVDLFRSWIAANPIEMVYPLSTPTWEPFPAETQTALNALTTHPGTTYLTVASTDVAAPVRLTYVQDTRKVVDSLKLDLAEQITDLQAQIDQIRVTNNLA